MRCAGVDRVLVVALALAIPGCERATERAVVTRCALADRAIDCRPAVASDVSDPAIAVLIPGPVTASSTAETAAFGCVVSDGRVYCWGVAPEAQLGDGVSSHRARGPITVPDVIAAVDVVSVPWSTCALDRQRRVTCWGKLAAIEVMQKTREPHPSIVLDDAIAIETFEVQTCALRHDGAHCWGGNIPDGRGRQIRTAGITLVPRTASASRLFARGPGMCVAWPDQREHCWSVTPLPYNAP